MIDSECVYTLLRLNMYVNVQVDNYDIINMPRPFEDQYRPNH